MLFFSTIESDRIVGIERGKSKINNNKEKDVCEHSEGLNGAGKKNKK